MSLENRTILNTSSNHPFNYDISNNSAYFLGKLGIGKVSSPSYSLDVSSDARIDGSISATNYITLSDYRIKDDVISLKNSEYNIDNLKPVYYTNKKTNKKDFGFIAHQIQEEFPFMVIGEKDEKDANNNEIYQGVCYVSLIALLVKEVQELKIRIRDLEEKKTITNNKCVPKIKI
jgi:hypothetical protein